MNPADFLPPPQQTLAQATPAPTTSAWQPQPGPSEPDGGELWRTEQITGRELAALAAKLLKRPSDDKQSVGRALLKAIKGELFAQHGVRDRTAWQIAGEVIEEYPNCDPQTVINCFASAINRAALDGSDLTEARWLDMLERIQDERRTRINMAAGAGGKLGKLLQAQAARVTQPMPEGAAWVLQAAAPGVSQPSTPYALNTLLIKADGRYYLRRPSESVYRWVLDSHESLAIELAHQFGTSNQEVITHDATGAALPIGDLVKVYASNAHRIVHDYASPRTTWNAQEQTLFVGLPDNLASPLLDTAVHEWLVALAGGEPAVRDLYDWIAATAREYIDRPAAGLVLVGPKDTGKSLLALALAATWGVLPVKMANAVERFNGALLGSPFWHADERVPDDLTDSAYREIVQARSRLIEPKGREKVELRGCARLIITLNEPEDLRLGGLEGPNALEAVVDRIAYFDHTPPEGTVSPATLALDALRYKQGPRAHDVDLGRIIGHLRAVQVGYTPRTQRFLGAREDRTEARKLVIQQGIGRQNAPLVDALVDYLADPDKWERAYHAEERAFTTGQRYPIITDDGFVWVWPRELADRLCGGAPGGRRFLWADLRRALKSMRAGAPREITFGKRALRAEYWPVDLDKLLVAANITEHHPMWSQVIQTCAGNTRIRKGLPDE